MSGSRCMDEGIGESLSSTEPAKYVHLLPVNPCAMMHVCAVVKSLVAILTSFAICIVFCALHLCR